MFLTLLTMSGQCVICLSEYTQVYNYVYTCKHIVCNMCKKMWIKACRNRSTKHTCPVCRCVQPDPVVDAYIAYMDELKMDALLG